MLNKLFTKIFADRLFCKIIVLPLYHQSKTNILQSCERTD